MTYKLNQAYELTDWAGEVIQAIYRGSAWGNLFNFGKGQTVLKFELIEDGSYFECVADYYKEDDVKEL